MLVYYIQQVGKTKKLKCNIKLSWDRNEKTEGTKQIFNRGLQSLHKQSEMYSNRGCGGSTPIESFKRHITEQKPKPLSIRAMPKKNHLPPMPLAECHWSHLWR